jgi:hypothetical protein
MPNQHIQSMLNPVLNIIENHDPIVVTEKLDLLIPRPNEGEITMVDEILHMSTKTFTLHFEINSGWLWF